MSAQTSYEFDQSIGVEGARADMRKAEVISRLAEQAVPFGRVVVLGSDKDTQCKLPNVATDITEAKNTLGVSQHTHSVESKDDGEPAGYLSTQAVNVVKEGALLMKAEEAMDASSDVYVRYTAVKEEQTITWDADFVTDNLVDGKVGGLSIAQVPFNTDQATTLGDVATAIANANSDVDSATATGAREITVVSKEDKSIELSDFVVTAGASQAEETVALTVEARFNSAKGSIRPDNDGGTAALISGLSVSKSAAKDELAVVEINL
jgi:flagellar basal body rod protein FlgC